MSLEEKRTTADSTLVDRFFGGNLVLRIAIGILAGVILALVWPDGARTAMLLGNLFVQALKAVAPVLVLVLVASALANQESTHQAQMRPIVLLYLVGTFSAAFLAVTMSTLFPTTLTLNVTDLNLTPPQGIAEVLNNLLFKLGSDFTLLGKYRYALAETAAQTGQDVEFDEMSLGLAAQARALTTAEKPLDRGAFAWDPLSGGQRPGAG